jgi:antitoxin MazE
MQVAKWGNSLAVRLPKKLVDELGLKAGDNVELVANGRQSLELTAKLSRGEALKALRKFRGWMPKDFKFDREEAHARGRQRLTGRRTCFGRVVQSASKC